MAGEIQSFIENTVEQLRRVEKEYTLADWESAANGTPENLKRMELAQAAYMRFFADSNRYETAKRLHQSGAATDALTARQLKLIYLRCSEYRQDEETVEKLAALESDVRDQYYNFRGTVDGKALSDNELEDILSASRDSALVQKAWEASKRVGLQVADNVREMARLRNTAARRQGYRDYFHRSLTANEIDEEELMSLFGKLEIATQQPFSRLKAQIDSARAAHFGISVDLLYPWHYGDRFFQQVPDIGDDLNMDSLFADKDPVALSTATYDGLGMDVRDILARSDLYERTGKNQHAFCTHIDREGDIRTLNNLQPNQRWNNTLLHELGHAVYEKYLDYSLPWLLRQYAHLLSTEAIAIMMGGLTRDREWLEMVLGVPAANAEKVAALAKAEMRAERLIFTRWCLVMTNFERGLYANPDGDLDSLWWDLVERYQMLRRPPNRQAADWASKLHIALAPVYYQNYELGYLVAAQVQHCLQQMAGGIVNRKQAGDWLKDKFFKPGASADWSTHVATATGEPLNPDYFVKSIS